MKIDIFPISGACLCFLMLCPMVFAGGPEIEMVNARVEKVAQDHRGVVLTVTGIVKLFVKKVEGDDPSEGNAKWVAIPMESGEIRYLGTAIDAVSPKGKREYHARLKAMEGGNHLLQMWGTQATVEAGHVTRVTARDVGVLIPKEGERRFRFNPDELEVSSD